MLVARSYLWIIYGLAKSGMPSFGHDGASQRQMKDCALRALGLAELERAVPELDRCFAQGNSVKLFSTFAFTSQLRLRFTIWTCLREALWRRSRWPVMKL